MSGQDAELEQFRKGVSCAVLLERFGVPWQLDRKESSRHALKYRRGKGEVLIVNHNGRGWWDPQSNAKGDVFALVQHLDRSLNFGQVRKVLRPFVGLSPSFPDALRRDRRDRPDRPLPERWLERPRLRTATADWRYLTVERGLPVDVLAAADHADIVRQGRSGSVWFAYRCDRGVVSHIEVRGPAIRVSLRGGTKTLFRFAPNTKAFRQRLAITEAPIDALSLAAMEGMRADTRYVATGGGMGPGTIAAIEHALSSMAGVPGALVSSATDANDAGDRYAARHAELAAAAGVAFERLRPPVGTDWNDTLRQGRGS